MSESKGGGVDRRWSTRAVAWLAFAAFAAVITAIEMMAIRGQLDFAAHVMGLTGTYVYVVPVALEGGTLASAALALWATLQGDASWRHRMWTAIFLGGAAAANYVGALAAGRSEIAALYLAGFCIAALRMWHAILHRVRRDAHAPESPLRFPVLRWLMAPSETAKAFRVSVLDSLSPADALSVVRGRTLPVVTTEQGTVDLSKLSKAEAVRQAFAALGSYEATPAREWLAERGVKVDRSYVYTIANKLAAARRAEMHTVNGSESKAVAA